MTFVTAPLTPLILDKIFPLNDTRPIVLVYPAEFFVDQDKYLKWILLYGMLSASYGVTMILACQTMYAIGTQHACGLFSIIR